MTNEMKKFETLLTKLSDLLTETVEYGAAGGEVKTRNRLGQFHQKLLGGVHYNIEAAIDWLESDPKNKWSLYELRQAAARTFENQNGSEIAIRNQQQAVERVRDQLELIAIGEALKQVAHDVYVDKVGAEPFPFRPQYGRKVNADVGETDLMKSAKALGIKVGNVGTDYASSGGSSEVQKQPLEKLPDPTGRKAG